MAKTELTVKVDYDMIAVTGAMREALAQAWDAGFGMGRNGQSWAENPFREAAGDE